MSTAHRMSGTQGVVVGVDVGGTFTDLFVPVSYTHLTLPTILLV